MPAANDSSRVVVVVPLRPGAREEVNSLLEKGPPFDPDRAGLDRHEVFLTDEEAIFLFEAPDQSVLDHLARSTKLRDAAAAWHDYAQGAIRVADLSYAWSRSS